MATKKSESKEIQQNSNNGALVLDERPEWLKEGHRGSEDVGMNDIILPRIDVLQALSPQIKKKDPKYIEGAEQGIIFNTVSGELYGSEVKFIPIKFVREFIVWKDRDSGGGFNGSFQTLEDAEAEIERLDNPELYEAVETHVHFVLLVHDDGSTEEAVLSLAKSKRKVSRKLNTLVQMGGVDRFGKMYKLSAVEAVGNKGEYWTFDIGNLGWTPKDLYDRAEEVYKAIAAGQRKVDHGTGDEEAAGDATV